MGSFGNSHAQDFFTLGRLDSFLTANLLATTALEFRRRDQTQSPQSVPANGLEAELLPFTFGQLPQIVADSRDGFCAGHAGEAGEGKLSAGKLDRRAGDGELGGAAIISSRPVPASITSRMRSAR